MIRGEVDAIERLGCDGYVFLSTDAGKMAAHFNQDVLVSVGDKVGVSFSHEALHVFTAEGRALRHPAP
jgi:multiple sugar transport system ATP-binding protein